MAAALGTALVPPSAESVVQGARLLLQGEVVAFPTETVYGLGANALCVDAVQKIFTAKGRPQDNPLIVHVCSRDMLGEVARLVPRAAEELMDAFWPGPLSIILKKAPHIPDVVTAGLDTVAIRMPSHPAAQTLIEHAGVPVAAPSANISGRPSPTTAAHVWNDLHGRIPLILDGGQCNIGVESTVLDLSRETPVVLRPGDITLEQLRGVVPDVSLHEGTISPSQTPASPGMKYRHYAPQADVQVFEGETGVVAKRIRHRYHEEIENGLRPLILCSTEAASLYRGLHVRILGEGPRQTEQALFDELRRADEMANDVVCFHFQEEMGLAVRNRIMKAAAWKPREETIRG